jgi:C-terminal processing protease CtpA/Prc
MNKLLCLILLFAFSANAQTKITQTEKHKQVGLIWGLLKYHHPDISQGVFNWDFELINLINEIEKVDEQEKLNNELLTFVKKFNKPTTTFSNNSIKINSEKVFRKNHNYNWIEKTAFSSELRKELIRLKNNNNIGDYYASSNKLNKMLEFNNEKGIADFDPLLKSHRLLELYSFWNIIQYWDVNKYLTDTSWIGTLEELTDTFLNAKTISDYEIAKLNMFSKLNDSHSYQTSMFIYKSLFNHSPPFEAKIINDTILVNAIYNKKLAQKDDIDLGDLIVGLNNLSITDYINSKFSTLISTSNETYLRERLNRFILKSNIDSLQIQILTKKGELKDKTIKLYKSFKIENIERLIKKENYNWRKINSKITYINLSNISSKELSKIFKENKDDDGIILDLRNYPRNLRIKDFSKLLYPENKEFIKVLLPLKGNPSLGEYNAEAPLKIVSNPFKVGKKNSNYYKGKIVLLVNRQTGSMAEYFGMAIQQSPNCVTIGEQTMGAVMNITSAILPDKQEFYFTGTGAFYPNGEGVQRNGLRIDYYIKESAVNYNSELYIEKAVEIIKNNKE